jgi:hypothetical protein
VVSHVLSDFLTTISYSLHVYYICATFPAHLIILNLIMLMIFVEDYKLRNASFCTFFTLAHITHLKLQFCTVVYILDKGGKVKDADTCERKHSSNQVCSLVYFSLGLFLDQPLN